MMKKMKYSFLYKFKNSYMFSPLQSAFTEHFLHRDRLIKVQLHGPRIFIMDNYSTSQISLDLNTYFSTQVDAYGNLMSISIFGDKIVHLAHSNPTVLDQWTSLLHQYIHKIGFNNDYALLDKIGEGVSASVHLGKAQKSGQKVAVKKFSKRKMDEKDLKALYNEINVMRMIEGQYFPKLIGTYLTENSIYLVMEYVSGVNLKELKEKGTLSSRQIKKILLQISMALNNLHNRHIIHRDIKPQNIFYNKITKQIKIIDFGFSVYLPQIENSYSNCGTPGYAAPQTFKKDYAPSAVNDVFSLGVLAHFMFTSKLPFKQNSRSILLDSKQCNFSFSVELRKYPKLFKLIKQMVCHQSSRISLSQFACSSFFSDNQQSPTNPESRHQSKITQNLSALNNRAQSLCIRERCSSIKIKNQSKYYEPHKYLNNKRLITDRF